MKFRSALLLVSVLSFFSIGLAHAQCTSPGGAESQTRYSANKLYYCGNGSWHEVPGGGSGGGGGRHCVVGSVYVSDGQSHTFFSADNHANCASIGQARTCTNGVLSGSATYSHPFCTAPPLTCAGLGGHLVDSYCWFIGDPTESCDTVCAGPRGGCNLTVTRSAGSSGSDAFCEEVLDAVECGSGSVTAYDESWNPAMALGCTAETACNAGERYSGPVTNCSASAPNLRRACACNNWPAP